MEKKDVFCRYRFVSAGFFILCFFLLLGGPSVYGEEARGVTKDTIKVGLSCDFTGPAADDLGAEGHGGAARNYIRYVNAQGGVNGRKIQLIIEDDHYSPARALAAFKKLVFRDRILALLGPGGTGQTKMLTPQIEKEKVPSIGVSASENVVIPFRKYLFIPSSSYQDQIRIIVDYMINTLKADKEVKIAFVAPDNEWGKDGWEATMDRVKFYNLKVAERVIVPFSPIDVTSEILVLKRIAPDFVILHENLGGCAAVLRGAKRLGLATTFIGSYACNESLIGPAKEAADGVMCSTTFGTWYDKTPGMALVRNTTMKYEPARQKYRNIQYMQGWMTAMIMVEGMKRAGKVLTPDSLVGAIEGINNYDSGGVVGPVSFSSISHKGGEYCQIYKVSYKDRLMLPITGWIMHAK
ncbi:MAG: ABC transporter substrate-binding protein [Pseudomonadota bacterium]